MNNFTIYFSLIVAAIIGLGFGFTIATFMATKYWSNMFDRYHKIVKDHDESAICGKKKTKVLRYCLQTADMECKIKKHPLETMKDLGITYQHKTPQSMSAEWWFWNCENIPQHLPAFLREDELDPMECVGYGLSLDDARKIRDYKNV